MTGQEPPASFDPQIAAYYAEVEEVQRLLEAVRSVEHEPSLLGMSPHLLAVGRQRVPSQRAG